jgi:hypothetical protein
LIWVRCIRSDGRSALRTFGSLERQSSDLPHTLVDEDSGLPAKAGDMARSASLFDIVNGFFNRCRGDMVRFLVFPQGSIRKASDVVHTRLSG